MNAPRLRRAVRALVLDDRGCFLMVRLAYPHGAWWVLPGGGVDDGEDEIDALRRELVEETGLAPDEIGAVVWHRVHEFDLVDSTGTRWDGQSETVHLVRSARFDPRPAMTPDELRAENVDVMRWWTPDEVDAYAGSDRFAPHDVAGHVRSVITHGPAESPPVLRQTN